MYSKKFLIIFIFLFLFILIFNTFSFASDNEVIEFTYNSTDFTITLPSGYGTDYNYYMLVAGSNNNGIYLSLILTTFPFSYTTDRKYFVAQSDGMLYTGLIRGTSSSWTDQDLSSFTVNNFCAGVSSNSYSSGQTCISSNLDLSRNTIVQSNFNIYDVDGELVFQPPLTKVAILPEIAQVKEIPKVMGEILTMIIPIGLILFSIGLVIFLMRLVISRLT